MGCSGRSHFQDIRPEQKWDFISINDFKSTSWISPLAYGWLWASLVVSIAVYSVDTFTAIQLLAFNNWASSIKPAISVEVSRWIFSICIILSFVNLGYEYWRALRVMKRGAVVESYLDSLAVRLECIRMGKNGRGWKRFLVFVELTRSKKGVEYIALFTYFSLQAWIRVIFCSGPRQVVNALTLYALYVAQLDPKAADAGTSILQFFKNIGILAEQEHTQAVILSSMLFSLVIWVFAALCLIIGVLFYVLFLWHYIPNSDGGLSGFCERKINGRLTKIVSVKVAKALEDEELRNLKEARRAAKNGETPVLGRQATIPTLFDAKDDDRLPEMPTLNRNDTMTTLPLYSSRPGTPSSQQPTIPDLELNNIDQRRPYPLRIGTSSSALSNTSYASNAPLMGAAGEIGYRRTESPTPLSAYDTEGFPFPQRSTTANSNGSQWQRGPQPLRNGAPSRQMTMESYTASPTTYSDRERSSPWPQNSSVDGYSRSMSRGVDVGRSTPTVPSVGRQTPFAETDTGGRSTPGISSVGRQTPFAEMDAAGRSTPGISSVGRQTPFAEMDAAGRSTPGISSVGRQTPFAEMDAAGRSTPGISSVGRQTPFAEMDAAGRSTPGISSVGRQTPFAEVVAAGRSSPARNPDGENFGSNPRRWSPPKTNGQQLNSNDSGGYIPYNPAMRSASTGIPNPAPTFQPQQQRPYRNMTEPVPARNRQPTADHFDNQPPRQGTPQSQRGGYNDQYNPYRGLGSQPRVASPASYISRQGPPSQDGYRR